MGAPAVGAGRQIGEEPVCQKGGVAVLGAVERRRVRAVTDWNVDGIAVRHITIRHAIPKPVQISAPGPPVIKAHFQRLQKTVHHLFIGCQDRVISRVMTRVGGGVRIAVKDRLDPAATKLSRQIRLVDWQRRTVAHSAMVHRILAGQQRCPRRPAGAGDGHMVGETHRILHEGPQMRQIDRFGKLAIQTVGPQLVENNKQNIRLGRWRVHYPNQITNISP